MQKVGGRETSFKLTRYLDRAARYYVVLSQEAGRSSDFAGMRFRCGCEQDIDSSMAKQWIARRVNYISKRVLLID
jgi:hypothetical protein